MSDLKSVTQQPPDGVSASPLQEENLYVWGATVFGPDDTSWEGGIYSCRLMFTEQYPDKPPRVRFTSEMVRALQQPGPPLRRSVCVRVCATRSSHLAPPVMSPQFHPNIFPDGTLCLDLIQDQWSPVYTVSSILLAIRSLLTDPNCASPANPEAAHLYQTDRKQYSKKVRNVAEKSVCG